MSRLQAARQEEKFARARFAHTLAMLSKAADNACELVDNGGLPDMRNLAARYSAAREAELMSNAASVARANAEMRELGAWQSKEWRAHNPKKAGQRV